MNIQMTISSGTGVDVRNAINRAYLNGLTVSYELCEDRVAYQRILTVYIEEHSTGERLITKRFNAGDLDIAMWNAACFINRITNDYKTWR